jgi:hypothetical protein
MATGGFAAIDFFWSCGRTELRRYKAHDRWLTVEMRKSRIAYRKPRMAAYRRPSSVTDPPPLAGLRRSQFQIVFGSITP